MVIALLVLIALILLFGAGIVKGWLANLVGLGCGGLILVAAMLWVGSFFGENGVQYIFYGLMSAAALLLLARLAIGDPNRQEPPMQTFTAGPREQEPLPGTRERQALWKQYGGDIDARFSPHAKRFAYQYYDNRDVIALEELCRREVSRLDGPSSQ